MNAGKYNNIRIGCSSILCKTQTIPNIISDILYIRFLVVMSEQNRFLFLFQMFNFLE